MQTRKIFLQITKFLAKATIGFVLVLCLTVGLVHLPIIQKQITAKVSNYLSLKIGGRVNIERINFSILGHVSIEDLEVWDPLNKKIFLAHKIEVASSMVNLVSGDLVFDEIRIEGAEGKLVQSKEGLNIHYILDAFRPAKKESTITAKPVNIQFKKVLLDNILFDFTSSISGVSVAVNLGKFTSQDAEFSTKPTKIKADQVYLQQTVVDVLSSHPPGIHNTTVTKNGNKLLSPDFGTGIVFEIKGLELRDNDVSFNRNQVIETKKFDASHISLKNIKLSLSDILIRKDTLAASLQALSVQLPRFEVTDLTSAIHMNKDQLFLKSLGFASGISEVQANVIAPLNFRSVKDGFHTPVEFGIKSRIRPGDFDYFLTDAVLDYFREWQETELNLEGSYIMGKGKIKTVKLKTGNSELQADGNINDILNFTNINWKNLAVNLSIGSDFKKIITPFLQTIKIPPNMELQLRSSGNLKKTDLDANAVTTWGDVKATGYATVQANSMNIDMNLFGELVDLGRWTNQTALGPITLSAKAKGGIGGGQHVYISGLIKEVEILDQSIHQINFQGNAGRDSASIIMSIQDPNFQSEISSEISFGGPLIFTNRIQLDSFRLGRFLDRDTTLFVSGNTKSNLVISPSSLLGYLHGNQIAFQRQSFEYALDTLSIHAMISPTKSDLAYYTNFAEANLTSNFDIRRAPEVIQTLSRNIITKTNANGVEPEGARAANFSVELENANFLKLLGIDVDEFASLSATGQFDEQKQTASLEVESGEFKGYGISLDTMSIGLLALRDTVSITTIAKNLFYDSIRLGNLTFDLVTEGETSIADLRLTNDSVTLLELGTRILRADSGALFYPHKLHAFNHAYFLDSLNPVFVRADNVFFNHFKINRDDLEISLDGDLSNFEASLKNVDLAPLNFLLSPDTTIINKGHLSGHVKYSQPKQLDLSASIDSLILYNSYPSTISANVVSDGNQLPFNFLLTNDSNTIDLKGRYFSDNDDVDASLHLDFANLEMFDFLVAGFVEKMNGAIKGNATIRGPIKKPLFKGSLRFLDMGLTVANPKLTFHVQDDSIALNNSSLLFNHFTLFDKENHPLTISGNISSPDYQSLMYDLKINANEYSLISNPDSTRGKLRGELVIDSDIKLTGDGRNSNIAAQLTIKNATDLTFVNASDDIELLKAEGIVDFVDPALFMDSAALDVDNLYDSLIASLPDFNLNSTITIENNAALRIIINEQSGDYITASGAARLDLDYDRTGNVNLAGNYTIEKGVYRLSFYDLVKKNFKLVQGSSINWSGSPKNGDLSIKAIHTVESNSLGLIGHEIGENEKSIYKRSLDYEVGININGTIDKPIISFSLDLPQNEKVNYPVLANKLDRLRQPEYASELNKQVFGLLVLGGFLPESSADVNSNVIATTALSNSVNSLLASQLNRFASQYIKGVNIDVGIQSFSDYSAPGGKTQTAMDFRVSKKIMNDRLSFEIGGDFDINQDQSGAKSGKNYRGDIAIIYDLTGNGDKQLKLFNNETYDIIYQEIRNTGISVIFIREFEDKNKEKRKEK